MLILIQVVTVKLHLTRSVLLHYEGVITPHTFRYTWATNKIMSGENIKDVAEFMGDTEKTVRDNYEHLAPNYLAHMVD